jgi:hypothetical protein
MKVYILWIRHCESCANVIVHSKYKKRWLTDRKQGFEIFPNCTIIGLIQSFMFGYILLPEFLKLYPQFKKIDYYCTLLKRTMITNKLISHGLQKSKYKIKTSNKIGRLCNITERRSFYEKVMRKEFNRVSLKTSNKHVKEINRKYKRTGKKITKRIRKRTKNCIENNHETFIEETVPLLDPKSLNVIVCHGEILKKIFGRKKLKNVDSILAEYDTEKNSYKELNKIMNTTDLSDDTNSYKRINDERFYLHYKGENLNVKSDISLDEFEKQVKGLKINFKKRDNEITCEK